MPMSYMRDIDVCFCNVSNLMRLWLGWPILALPREMWGVGFLEGLAVRRDSGFSLRGIKIFIVR